jgi:hypothetical protein
VVLLCGASTYGVYALAGRYGGPDPGPTASPHRTTAAPRTAAPTWTPPTAPPAPTAPAPGGSAKPALKDVPQLRVLGPVYGPRESTYTMDFAGWPFAFRTPGTWGCIAGRVALPDTQARVCIDEGDPGAKHRVGVALRACAKPCSPATQRSYVKQWYDAGQTAKTWDPRTTFAEGRTPSGLYALDLCRFFGAVRGGPPAWQVCVTGSSPDATKATVQKVVNEIVSQTP